MKPFCYLTLFMFVLKRPLCLGTASKKKPIRFFTFHFGCHFSVLQFWFFIERLIESRTECCCRGVMSPFTKKKNKKKKKKEEGGEEEK